MPYYYVTTWAGIQAVGGWTSLTVYQGFMARDYDQVSKSFKYNQVSVGTVFSTSGVSGGAGGLNYPNPVDNSLCLAQPYVITINPTVAANSVLRGVLPGLYHPLHVYSAANDLSVFTDLAGLPGRSVLWLRMNTFGGALGAHAIDITGPWR